MTLDLTTLGNGDAAEQFAAFLAQMLERSDEQADSLQDGDGRYVMRDGLLVGKFTLAVTLSLDPERGQVGVTYTAVPSYPAIRPATTHTAIVAGRIEVEQPTTQERLPLAVRS